MSNEVAMQPTSTNTYDESNQQQQSQQVQPSLDTPSRDSNASNIANKNEINNVNNNNGGSGGGVTTTDNNEEIMDKIEETKIVKYSNLKSASNPLTIAREKANNSGKPLMVNFDERVVVHTVPYWDPCGETFYDNDDEDGPRGPNCCVLL